MMEEIQKIQKSDITRLTIGDDFISFFVCLDDKEEKEHSKEEHHHHLNGHLYRYRFNNVRILEENYEEHDFYDIKNIEEKEGNLSLQLHGSSFDGTNKDIRIIFEYSSLTIEDRGKIKEADC